MTGTLHFTYKSPANLVRLCTTILFEQDKEALKEHGYAWKKLLDTDEGEELFLQWMTKVLPEGGTIGEDELYRIKELAIDYLETDEDALEFQADYDKIKYDSWVYFKPHHKVYPVGFLKHYEECEQLLLEYFKGIDDYDRDKFKRFIENNIEIKSANTTINTILAMSDHILRGIIFSSGR